MTMPARDLEQAAPARTAVHLHAPTPQEGAPDRRARPAEYDPHARADELMNALVVEDSPQIAERLVELVSVPSRVEVVATAATEDEALAACDRYTISLAIVDLQLAQGTGFGVIRRLRAATGANPACIVVLTNHAVPALKVAAFEAGADYFLDKSKDFATIPRLIGELLSGREN
ncbi:MAG TPA: response regulator [Usitatibacter sp.]|jgi:DNA-binding response OmpR family regulator|nr:response regulator [Usitatibacter sp.]